MTKYNQLLAVKNWFTEICQLNLKKDCYKGYFIQAKDQPKNLLEQHIAHMPTVPATAYVDDSAVLIGDVRIGDRVYVAPVVSLRADEAHPIIIGDERNIQGRRNIPRP